MLLKQMEGTCLFDVFKSVLLNLLNMRKDPEDK